MARRGFLADFNSSEWDLARIACENNDTTLMDQAISMTSEEDLEQLYDHARRTAIKDNSTTILSYLIERGVSVKTLKPSDVVGSRNTSKATLEFLLAHGWDINTRDISGSGGDAQPFMWHVVSDGDMVAWCLEHGASVHPRDQEPLRDDVVTKSQRSCQQILEKAAAWGSVATFELLRSKGAPLGWRPLHLAVETATYGHPDRAEAEKDTEKEKQNRADHVERMAMVRHLLDVVGLDVNALDQPAGGNLPNRNGTPICYIPGSRMLERDTRELTWLLLDRGADPTPALEVAKLGGYTRFAEDVEAWKKAQQGDDRKCCVQ